MKLALTISILSFALFVQAPAAQAFSIAFDWKGLRLCTNGKPTIVPSPRFRVRDVPRGTRSVVFKMVDLNVPRYRHGGGIVNMTRSGDVKSGAFTYKSPCPPRGSHVYEWTAVARSGAGGRGETLAVATARARYPL